MFIATMLNLMSFTICWSWMIMINHDCLWNFIGTEEYDCNILHNIASCTLTKYLLDYPLLTHFQQQYQQETSLSFPLLKCPTLFLFLRFLSQDAKLRIFVRSSYLLNCAWVYFIFSSDSVFVCFLSVVFLLPW